MKAGTLSWVEGLRRALVAALLVGAMLGACGASKDDDDSPALSSQELCEKFAADHGYKDISAFSSTTAGDIVRGAKTFTPTMDVSVWEKLPARHAVTSCQFEDPSKPDFETAVSVEKTCETMQFLSMAHKSFFVDAEGRSSENTFRGPDSAPVCPEDR